MTSRCCNAAVALTAILVLAASCGEKTEEETVPAPPVGVNLVKNPSFEEWNGALPIGWKLEHFDGVGKKKNLYGKSTDEKKSG